MKTYIMDVDVTTRKTIYIEAKNEDDALTKARAKVYDEHSNVLDWDYSILSEGEWEE
jgi:CTP:phosphocholine cytidylyltransferase-like protein